MNSMLILNTLIILGIISSAVIAIVLDNKFTAVVAFIILALLMSIEYIILHAPDLAIFELITGVVILPMILLFAFKKLKEGKLK